MSDAPQLMGKHWHDNDVIDRLKQVAREIGISIQVPAAKKMDIHAIKEEAAKNLEELKQQLDKASGGADAAAVDKKIAKLQPAIKPERLLDIEEEKLHRAKSYERELVQRRQQMERKLDEMQRLSADLDKKADPSDELQSAVLAVNKEGLMIKVRDLTTECEKLEEDGETYRHMQRRLQGFLAAEKVLCDDIGREIKQHDEDLVKLRERLRDSVKEITGSLHVDDMEHARLLMQETLVGYENMLKIRRQELQDLRSQAEAAKKRDDIYARIETSLLRMYDPGASSPRRDTVKKKLVEFERSFGLLMNKLGNFESDTIISMFNTQMQSESVWKASVKHAKETLASLTQQHHVLQLELHTLRERGYTVQSGEEDTESCAFGGSHLLKRAKSPMSPQLKSSSADADSATQSPTAEHSDPAQDSDRDLDLLQFKPISTATVEIAMKKANLKSDKLIEIERVMAALRMGVCTLVERLAGVNMLPPELRELIQSGPPSIDINDDDCSTALQIFSQTMETVLDSLENTLSPLGRSPSRRSPLNRSPAPSEKRGSISGLPIVASRHGSISHLDFSGVDSPGKFNRRFSLSLSMGLEPAAPASPVINPWAGSAKVSATAILPPSEHTARSRRLTMEDEGDRANEDLKKKDERRQQKLLMKNKSIADQAKAAAADAVAVMKKIITEMPPAVLLSAEEKHKSNPYNVRVNVEELAARMEEVAKADNKLMRGRRKQVAKNSDDDDDEDEDDQVAEPQSAQASSSPTMGGPPLDENGNPLPQKTFTMILDGKEVELVHTQFRVSEDHKLRSMLKRQSAKAAEKLKIERGEIEAEDSAAGGKGSKKATQKDSAAVSATGGSPESPKGAKLSTRPEKK